MLACINRNKNNTLRDKHLRFIDQTKSLIYTAPNEVENSGIFWETVHEILFILDVQTTECFISVCQAQ